MVQAQVEKNTFLIITDGSLLDTLQVGKMDSIVSKNLIYNKLIYYISSGYFLIELTDLKEDSINRFIQLSKGSKYYGLLLLDKDSLPEKVKHILGNELIKPTDWSSRINTIISEDNNSGFPLSKIKLVPVIDDSDTLKAKIEYDQGPLFYFGEIDEGENRIISERYLSRILSLKQGRVFQDKTIRKMESLMSKFPYLETEYPPRINFEGNQVNIKLYLKKKQANSFDFLIGFNNSGSGPTRKVQLTGQANFDLHNSFKVGERFFMHYENLQQSSPRINVLLDFPYISLIPFGMSVSSDLIKSFDNYINIQSFLKISQLLNPRTSLRFILHNNYSYVLNADSIYIKLTNRLPSVVDFNHTSYGLEFTRDIRDNLISPTKGYDVNISSRIGQKKVLQSNAILKFDSDESLVRQIDSLNNNNLQFNIGLQGSIYYLLLKRSVIKFGINSQILINKAGILENELIKIGGIKTIRGFNDNFFSSDKYIISTLEYRFLLDKFSYLNLFIDHSFMTLISQNEKTNWKNYLGIGTGLQLQTKAGAFGLFLASSRTEESNFDLSSLKVHFGYLARF